MLRVLAAALVFASLACNSPAFGQATALEKPAQPYQSTPLAKGRITGKVFCADTRKPARGALVLLDLASSETEKRSSQTGEWGISRVGFDGTYTLEDIAPGSYVISAVLPGYLPPFDDVISPVNKDAEKNAGKDLSGDGKVSIQTDETKTLDISLERGASVSGRVLYPDGSPAIQVSISTEDVNAKPLDGRTIGMDRFARSMLLHPTQTTDDLGRFRISGIAPGTYRIMTIQSSSTEPIGPSFQLLPGMILNFKALRIYSDDTLHRSAAKLYELRPGDEVTGIEITLPTDSFHSVRGLLTARDGRPINMGTVTLTDSTDDTLIFYGNLERDGTFHFGQVPSGNYTLEATNANIGKLPGNLPPLNQTRSIALKITNAFANGSTSVLVKDSDVSNISLILTEVPVAGVPK